MTFLEYITTRIDPKRVLISDHDKSYAQCDQSSNVAPSMPFIVIKVASSDELIWTVQACIRYKMPIVMRGSGTGKSGGAVASPTAVVIDISGLNRILEINVNNLTVDVEPGVILGDLQAAVKKVGLFYPPDPASWATCTIGGNVAENAAGPSTLKYGCTRNYLLGGLAIIGTGEIIDFGKRCPKGVTGYDIASLLCGSEGTLAIFTQFTLRLLPNPKDESTALFIFDNDNKALNAVTAVLHNGHLPKTLEYIDHHCMAALKKSGHLGHIDSGLSALLIECDASYLGGAHKQIEAIAETLKGLVLQQEFASSPQERLDLWRARSHLSAACSSFLGHKLSEDMAIPLCSMQEFAEWFRLQEQNPHLLCGLFGHAGDGNLHVQIMFDDKKYNAEAQNLRHNLLLKVLSLGGTLSAEHGIGLQKKSYLHLEQSKALIDTQKRIKKAFDPYNLLNPGKIFDI